MYVCMCVCMYVCMDEQTEAARASTYLEQTTAPSFKGTGPCNQPSCDVKLNVITWLRPPHSLPRPLDGPWDHWTDHWTDQGTIGPTIGRSNHWSKRKAQKCPDRPSVDRTSLYCAWLAGWLRPREPRRTLDSSCQVCSVWFCCLAILGLEERWGSSCRVCMYVCMYCLVCFSCIFEPRRTLGLQLSAIVWSFCLATSGPEENWVSSCRLLSCLF